MTNSTVSGNTGVFGGIGNRGTLTMTNSTVSGRALNRRVAIVVLPKVPVMKEQFR